MAGNITTTAATKAFRVGIVIGSRHVPRAGANVTDFVLVTLGAFDGRRYAWLVAKRQVQGGNVDDIKGNGRLPVDGGGRLDGIQHKHTRAWSRRVAGLDGFIFVSPQYNRGVPAGLKNAVDYLFSEWVNKPAAVVTYGGHGGNKADLAWRTIFFGGGIGMRLVAQRVNLKFPDRAFTAKAASGENTDFGGVWADKRGDIEAMWHELVGLLVARTCELEMFIAFTVVASKLYHSLDSETTEPSQTQRTNQPQRLHMFAVLVARRALSPGTFTSYTIRRWPNTLEGGTNYSLYIFHYKFQFPASGGMRDVGFACEGLKHLSDAGGCKAMPIPSNGHSLIF